MRKALALPIWIVVFVFALFLRLHTATFNGISHLTQNKRSEKAKAQLLAIVKARIERLPRISESL